MNRIAALRRERGWNQADLSNMLNVSYQAIGHYESGRRSLDVETINALCDIFSVTADYLLGRSDQPTPEISAQDWALLDAYHRASLRDRDLVDRILSAWAEPAGEKGTAV